MSAATERLFYDGNCGLCHWAVRFVLKRDRAGQLFRFAPLDSDLLRALVPEAERIRLGETLVVHTVDGEVLARSRAVLHIMRRLGFMWRCAAGIIGLIPAVLLDRLYDFVAWNRGHLFRRPKAVCPIMSPDLQKRFDLERERGTP